MAKIKVQVFKKSGKLYTEETYYLEGFPSIHNQPSNTTLEILKDRQMLECLRIIKEIREGNMLCYCPVNKWEGYYFIIDGIFDYSENGYLTYLLNCTEME